MDRNSVDGSKYLFGTTGTVKVKLADGSWVSGFVCEAIGAEGGTDITYLGSWRVWLAKQG